MNNLPYDVLQSIREYLPTSDRRSFREVDKTLYSFANRRYSQDALRNEDIQHNLELFYAKNPTINITNTIQIVFDVPGTSSYGPHKAEVHASLMENMTEMLVKSRTDIYHRQEQVDFIRLSLYYIVANYPDIVDTPLSLYFECGGVGSFKSLLGSWVSRYLARFNWSNARYFLAYDNEDYIISTLDSIDRDIDYVENALKNPISLMIESPQYPLTKMTLSQKESILSRLLTQFDYFVISTKEYQGHKRIDGSFQGFKFIAWKTLYGDGRFKIEFIQNEQERTYIENEVMDDHNDNDVEEFIANELTGGEDDETLGDLILPSTFNVGLVLYACLLKINIVNIKYKLNAPEDNFPLKIKIFTAPIKFENESLAGNCNRIVTKVDSIQKFLEGYSIEAINQIFQERIALVKILDAVKFDLYPEDDFIMED